ncbi:hypothetical protein ACFGWM_03400 [Pasteurella multocida]
MNILHTYFNSQLVNAGLPDDLEICWSLSYCQGDGVAFYGNIPHSYWSALFACIYPNQKRKLRKFERLVQSLIEWEFYCDSLIEIQRNQFGHRYSHFGTMVVDARSAEGFQFFYHHEAQKTWYFPKDKVFQYQALWNEFITDLAEYIRDISRRLASEGYRIIEATPSDKQFVYQFDTAHYSVQLVAEHSDFYNQPPECFFDDLDGVHNMLNEVINGESYYANLCAQVIDRYTGQSLGKDYLYCACFDPKDKGFSGYKVELIRNAIADARRNVQQLAALHA